MSRNVALILAITIVSTAALAADGVGRPPRAAPNASGDCRACVEDSKGGQHCYKIPCKNMPPSTNISAPWCTSISTHREERPLSSSSASQSSPVGPAPAASQSFSATRKWCYVRPALQHDQTPSD